jgi:pimeloyl-ACP methyl ester carboxylesterase
MMKFAVARGNVQIAYDVLGTGAPVALLHDFGETSGFWYETGCVKACLARGRQVVLVDLRGHGDSSEPVDATAYAPIHCGWDVIAVLDHAGIGRADLLGYGVGGRIALCLAAFAPDRVHAVAAGAAHPFAERAQRWSEADGLEPWVRMIQKKGAKVSQPAAKDPAVLTDAVVSDWPDIANAVKRSGTPILLFAGKDDPRYPLVLSFAEQSGAKLIMSPRHDGGTATGTAELLPRILDFFEAPQDGARADNVPPCLWSGSWS